MRRIIIIIGLFLMCLADIYAQKLNVESFVAKTNDITARTQPRLDNNGNDCALVKVRLAAGNASFSGNVFGDVAYDKSEYFVYMPHGSKRLTIKLEGYLPLDVCFSEYGIISLEGKTVYVLTLSGVTGTQQLEAPKTKTGWIIIDSEPSGASVYINDEFVGNTPLSNYKQAYGTYQYRLESPNYHSVTGIIELNAGRFEQKVVLKPAFGSISVKSSIAGAKILLDGKQTGRQTPVTLTEIPSGSHTITLQIDKYAPRQQEVIVEDGQTANVSMTLDARFARITINSLDGAEIYSNGRLLGKGRISDDMMEGYYDLEARLDHHKTVTKQIQVVAGQLQDITLSPIPKYGSLDIVSTPHDATITIDGEEVGKTPFTIEKLLEGEHTVAISKEGYSVFKKVVNITENNTETVSATMEKRVPIANKTTLPQGNAQISINKKNQELNVKSFIAKTNDITARTQPRQDINGNDCALVKVQIVGQGVTFSGNVVDVNYKGNEYWVYMPNGSKRLKITHPDYLPMEVLFDNYGIGMVQGKNTYVLTVVNSNQSSTNVENKLFSGYVNILSDRKLQSSDIDGKSKKELEILRNMIYAKYGYRFKRDDLFKYFSQYEWYHPITSDASDAYSRMSSIEHYNIDFIKKFER